MNETLDALEALSLKMRNENCPDQLQQEFSDLFFKVLDESDFDGYDGRFSFEGSGSYGGKNWIIDFTPYMSMGRYFLQFEIEVDFHKPYLKIYTAQHNGYWVPEFLITNDPNLISKLKNKLINALELD